MILKKIKRNNYLLLKLNSRDAQYLKNYRKFEHADTVKKASEYLNNILSLHIKAVFVMTAALMLNEEGLIKKKTYDLLLKEFDRTLAIYGRTVDRFFNKFGRIMDSKIFKKTQKTRKKH